MIIEKTWTWNKTFFKPMNVFFMVFIMMMTWCRSRESAHWRHPNPGAYIDPGDSNRFTGFDNVTIVKKWTFWRIFMFMFSDIGSEWWFLLGYTHFISDFGCKWLKFKYWTWSLLKTFGKWWRLKNLEKSLYPLDTFL